MTNAVFYSVSPYGTGTLETGSGSITVTNGVATLSVEQTGNIGVGDCILYAMAKSWIAPNRIAFTSGGTTELLTGTKIVGGTSGATGIIRAIEVNSGTWGAGTAAGWIYFESTTGTWNSSEQINRTKPTSSTNIATTNGSLEGNIGNGNTKFVVKTATGGTPSDQTVTAVTEVRHEWASLADFESFFTNSDHINNTSLVAADVVVHACCYYDHDDQTADGSNHMYWTTNTTDSTRYLAAYTPVGGSESINNQRHSGKWNTNKYHMIQNSYGYTFSIRGHTARFEGLQIYDYYGTGERAITVSSSGVDTFYVDACIIRTNIGNGIDVDYGTCVCRNTIIYCGTTQDGGSEAIHLQGSGVAANVYNCVIYNYNDGLELSNTGTFTVRNCAVFNNADDFDIVHDVEFCASDDGNGTDEVHWLNGATDWGNVFVDYSAAIPDFDLNDFSGTGAIIDQGTPLFSAGLWRDIVGTERGSSWDIGAFEYVSAGPSVSIPVIMHHLRQQGIA